MLRYQGLEHRPRAITQLAQHVGAFLVSQARYTPWSNCQEFWAGLPQPLFAADQATAPSISAV
ncbi:MAG: hypothetical protein ABSE77_14815 [Acidimicrobiales bacterium]|jgi:D-alanyl-D-alanine dipeptidase